MMAGYTFSWGEHARQLRISCCAYAARYLREVAEMGADGRWPNPGSFGEHYDELARTEAFVWYLAQPFPAVEKESARMAWVLCAIDEMETTLRNLEARS